MSVDNASARKFPVGISVFFPAYNDAPTLPGLIEKTFSVLCREASDYEVIVVNDGSTDATGQILDELARIYPRLRVITHQTNRGYGGALRSGFASASKDIIFYTDGDAQYDPSEMAALWLTALSSSSTVTVSPVCISSHQRRGVLPSRRS